MKKARVLFVLMIFMVLFAVNLYAQQYLDLRIGASVNGILPQRSEVWYRVIPNQNGLLVIEHESPDYDAYLEVFDANRNFLAEDDDSGGSMNSRLEMNVTRNTTYLIRIRSYNSRDGGTFTIRTSFREPPAPVDLRVGTSHNGYLASGDEHIFNVRPTSDGFIVVETTGDSFDAYLEAYDSNNNWLASDDDGGQGLNSRIMLRVARNQVYTFKLRALDRYSTGYYGISAVTFNPRITELRLGQARNANLGSGEEHWYSVRTTSAGLLVVETTGDTLDAFLEAYDTNYTMITSNDDGGEGLNSRIELRVERNQTYYFVFRSLDRYSPGPYGISAFMEVIPQDAGNTTRQRALSIRIGETIPAYFFIADEARWYSFTVPRGGANISIWTESNLDTTLALYDSNGDQIAFDDDSGDGGNAFILQRLNQGTYFIEARTYGGYYTGRFSIVVSN